MRHALPIVLLAGLACGPPPAPTAPNEARLDCAGPHSLADSATGRMQGDVSNATTDLPLANLQVVVSGRGQVQEAVTDRRGHWMLGDLPEGEYVVVVKKNRTTLYESTVHLCPMDVLTLRTPIWRP